MEHRSSGQPRRRAWVTLLTNAPYGRGVVALAHSLAEAESSFPLVVLVTEGVPAVVRQQCKEAGCEVREVEPLSLPAGVGGPPHYACAHFAECWTKLRAWELEDEFEQLCLLDADMIVLKDVDELLATPLPCAAQDGGEQKGEGGAAVRAVHECFCNVDRGGACCAYLAHGADRGAAPPVGGASYFNSGLVVLRPSRAVFAGMLAALAGCDLASLAFPDQDFLNAYFRGAWEALPYTYNATKGMYAAHRGPPPERGLGSFELSAVRVLHFTMAKPWDLRHPCHKGYERLNTLWHAAFAEPHTLGRALLQAHLAEKRTQKHTARTVPPT